jgi:hypothetical protein
MIALEIISIESTFSLTSIEESEPQMPALPNQNRQRKQDLLRRKALEVAC